MIVLDDGPGELTVAFLDCLDEHPVEGEAIMFGLVGEHALKNPEIVREIDARGYGITNHSWSHRRLTEATRGEVYMEFAATNQLLEFLTERRPWSFRPPYVACSPDVEEVARMLDMTVLWKSSVGDYNLDPDAIVEAAAGTDGFVGLHELPQTLKALPRILEARCRRA